MAAGVLPRGQAGCIDPTHSRSPSQSPSRPEPPVPSRRFRRRGELAPSASPTERWRCSSIRPRRPQRPAARASRPRSDRPPSLWTRHRSGSRCVDSELLSNMRSQMEFRRRSSPWCPNATPHQPLTSCPTNSGCVAAAAAGWRGRRVAADRRPASEESARPGAGGLLRRSRLWFPGVPQGAAAPWARPAAPTGTGPAGPRPRLAGMPEPHPAGAASVAAEAAGSGGGSSGRAAGAAQRLPGRQRAQDCQGDFRAKVWEK